MYWCRAGTLHYGSFPLLRTCLHTLISHTTSAMSSQRASWKREPVPHAVTNFVERSIKHVCNFTHFSILSVIERRTEKLVLRICHSTCFLTQAEDTSRLRRICLQKSSWLHAALLVRMYTSGCVTTKKHFKPEPYIDWNHYY